SPVPVVAAWHGTNRYGFPTVEVDNLKGISRSVDELLTLGHERIGFIGGESFGDVRDRQLAYEELIRENGLPVVAGYIQTSRNTLVAGANALERLMALAEPPTAVIAATDVRALGAIHGAWSLGLKVPRDLSVIGFDDIPFASVSVPPLTTVQMPTAAMVARV